MVNEQEQKEFIVDVINSVLAEESLVKQTLKFTKMRDVKNIQKANTTDAGFDFFVPNDFNRCAAFILEPGKDILIPSGIKVVVPVGYALIAQNKSGIATKFKCRTGACVVDTDYRGEVHIHLFNDGVENVKIEPGMKIVQFVLTKIGTHQAEEISQEEYQKYCNTDRGEGGFGSTGV